MNSVSKYEWDVFISHASEDSEDIAYPLANLLEKNGVKVWIDNKQLKIGDSLRRKIEEGLSKSRFGVVILSHSFFNKEWPRKELDALISTDEGDKVSILPVWHGITKEDIAEYSPLLADKLAVLSSKGLDVVVYEILKVVSPHNSHNLDNIKNHPFKYSQWRISLKTSTLFEVKTFAIYRDMLFAGGEDDNQINGQLYQYDGINWKDLSFSAKVGAKVDFIESLLVFNDRLYIGTRVDIRGIFYNRVYYYDGKAFYLDFSAPGIAGYSGIESLVIHNDTLYASNGSPVGEVYQRINDQNWNVLGKSVDIDTPVRTLASFSGFLYAGTGSSRHEPKVWKWADKKWNLIRNFRDDNITHPDSVFCLVPYKKYLYAGLIGGGNKSPVLAYDGIVWVICHNIFGSQYIRLSLVEEKLMAGAHGGQIYFLKDEVSWEWEEIQSISGAPGVFTLIQYKNALFASTFGYKGIYKLDLINI